MKVQNYLTEITAMPPGIPASMPCSSRSSLRYRTRASTAKPPALSPTTSMFLGSNPAQRSILNPAKGSIIGVGNGAGRKARARTRNPVSLARSYGVGLSVGYGRDERQFMLVWNRTYMCTTSRQIENHFLAF
jgi:hypothetical protein